ncbi:MAG: transposase, partial [Thermoplasmatales archaeon]|nr:transposase [Thermoplasmatales archaeon]
KRNLPCKHAASVRFYLEKQTVLPTGETVSERVPVTYEQAWATYDRAQMEEVRLFDMLLADLVADVPAPEQETGRPRIPLRDELFCAVQKVYSQLSCRRAHSLFGFAVERGQLPKTHGFVVSSRALNREDVTPILHGLITKSALPLAALEQGFAPDSTGIRTTSFGGWREEKHGEKREHVWLKAHALAGVNTHVIIRASITGKDGADNPQFEPLVREASKAGFPLKEVYADKAYSARANYALAGEIGFDLYVPFRSNATGQSKGTRLWRKAFLYFQMHREEFEAKYHARSNVESVFSALKRKFGETLRSKNPTAQTNELLAKILAYNLTVLIHEIFEHGVVPDFLRDPSCVRKEAPVSEAPLPG